MKKMDTFILSYIRRSSEKYLLLLTFLPVLIVAMDQNSHQKKWINLFYEYYHSLSIKCIQFFFPAPIDTHCYLADLPKDITNIIASYLPLPDREYDGEFIRRTQFLKQGTGLSPLDFKNIKICFEKTNQSEIKCIRNAKSCCNTYKINFYNKKTKEHKCVHSFLGDYYLDDTVKFSLSADFTKLILIKHFYLITDVLIKDVRNEKNLYYTKSPIYDELPDFNTCNLAIDNTGKFLAYINATDQSNYELWVLDILKGKTVLNVPKVPLVDVMSLDFNKQSTKLVIHGCDEHDGVPSYQMYNIAVEAQENIRSKHLAEYFQLRGICKNWPQHQKLN